jgi:hypothetical protein
MLSGPCRNYLRLTSLAYSSVYQFGDGTHEFENSERLKDPSGGLPYT